ncbi:MAG: DHHA1 domain-containing protein [Bryobacteraceae bacterium]
MTTTRLYHHDSYLTGFSAHVVDRSADGRRVYLDRTAFYPDSGGQPHDIGEIGGVAVLNVVDEDKRIAHLTEEPVEGIEVACRVNWARRFDHMQQHTGQHLLSAVLSELCGAGTVGFHLGASSSTIDLDVAALRPDQVSAAQIAVNERIAQNRRVEVTYEAASEADGLRRQSSREGVLRIVSIEGVDRSACGGTHVRATGEIGLVLIRRLDKVRGNVRVEFLCGMRAVEQAGKDYQALSRIARVLSCSLEDSPALVEAQREALEAADKARRRMAGELARYQGRDLYQATAPGPDGMRRALHRLPSGSLSEELRAMAAGFTAQPKAVFLAVVEEPPSLLLAVSTDAGIHAGERLKAALAACGGRGGGSAQVAQGSAPSREHLAGLLAALA